VCDVGSGRVVASRCVSDQTENTQCRTVGRSPAVKKEQIFAFFLIQFFFLKGILRRLRLR
jgi:hypothetical protein